MLFSAACSSDGSNGLKIAIKATNTVPTATNLQTNGTGVLEAGDSGELASKFGDLSGRKGPFPDLGGLDRPSTIFLAFAAGVLVLLARKRVDPNDKEYA